MAKKGYKVDFTGVESFGLIPEGKYPAKVVAAEINTNSQGNDQLKVTFQITKGEHKGDKIINFFVFVDAALWKLKEFMESCGMKADGKLTIDPDKFIGKTCEIVVFEDEYEGNTRSKISNYMKLGGEAASKKSKDEDEDEDDEEEDDDDEDEEEEEPPKKSKKSSKKEKPAPAKKGKKKPDPEEDEDDEDEDEDDEPKKKKSSKSSSKSSKKASKKSSKKQDDDDDDDDEDEDWDDDEDDD